MDGDETAQPVAQEETDAQQPDEGQAENPATQEPVQQTEETGQAAEEPASSEQPETTDANQEANETPPVGPDAMVIEPAEQSAPAAAEEAASSELPAAEGPETSAAPTGDGTEAEPPQAADASRDLSAAAEHREEQAVDSAAAAPPVADEQAAETAEPATAETGAATADPPAAAEEQPVVQVEAPAAMEPPANAEAAVAVEPPANAEAAAAVEPSAEVPEPAKRASVHSASGQSGATSKPTSAKPPATAEQHPEPEETGSAEMQDGPAPGELSASTKVTKHKETAAERLTQPTAMRMLKTLQETQGDKTDWHIATGVVYKSKKLNPDEMSAMVDRLCVAKHADDNMPPKPHAVKLVYVDGKEAYEPVKEVSKEENINYMSELYNRCQETRSKTQQQLADKYLQPLFKPVSPKKPGSPKKA